MGYVMVWRVVVESEAVRLISGNKADDLRG